jgi:hypothetical protein
MELTKNQEIELKEKAEWIVKHASHFFPEYGRISRESIAKFLGVGLAATYKGELNIIFKENKKNGIKTS